MMESGDGEFEFVSNLCTFISVINFSMLESHLPEPYHPDQLLRNNDCEPIIEVNF